GRRRGRAGWQEPVSALGSKPQAPCDGRVGGIEHANWRAGRRTGSCAARRDDALRYASFLAAHFRQSTTRPALTQGPASVLRRDGSSGALAAEPAAALA